MIDNFRLTISLAVLIKKQYEDIVSPDPGGEMDDSNLSHARL